MKGAYIFLANGFEEIEAIATVDVLRRGGIDARTVSINDNAQVCGAHGVPVIADMTWDIFKRQTDLSHTGEQDVMVFPGGMPGTKNLADNQELMELMRLHYSEGGVVAAICAAPGLVIPHLPTLDGKRFTCYDGFEAAPSAKGGEYVRTAAVSDGNLITGRGPGCAVDFALSIVERLKGVATAAEIRSGMMI
ncbi:MAG TPA: DJ-1 family protein [Rikenellaceae bacterium]|nr:DJ-1 family protein [Rikenellaceae bacterium]